MVARILRDVSNNGHLSIVGQTRLVLVHPDWLYANRLPLLAVEWRELGCCQFLCIELPCIFRYFGSILRGSNIFPWRLGWHARQPFGSLGWSGRSGPYHPREFYYNYNNRPLLLAFFLFALVYTVCSAFGASTLNWGSVAPLVSNVKSDLPYFDGNSALAVS